ncbi:DUF6456 domain-containing protein [Rhodobacter capsulatus]|uniref:DUF6456 domain-containing protein n=2 Tax=root TaxID=1 RepID=D5AUH1_RHOCB|nr:DUF6456 domain-containing protein [Rhodobacter capsulatus]DBA12217.1 TPA_asm: transcriptional regulator [Rhodobactegtaviriform marrsi]ADE85610.1 conserved hypothetical protein [Rhodobacter capsulatus SB 1003]ETD01641.1 hypothetical protein U714_10635 [Rhodobacter capsulatus DE442]ETD76708.1 hypothetical protein U717_10790 [Rhodobacter capsulatus R121]ETE53544.1 hypothetical protein U715_10790 [Rhodobacter capsulatus Y262]
MKTMQDRESLPDWLPDHARLYLRHVEEGVPIRQLARAEGCHASTILRRVRRIEQRRDDPLVDEALTRLGRFAAAASAAPPREDDPAMTAPIRPTAPQACPEAAEDPDSPDIATLSREGRRVLRRLAEPGALLIIAPDMEKAVVLRGTVRTAVVAREVAQGFALNGWILVQHSGRVTSYELSATGRAALKRLLEAEALTAGRDPATAADNPHADRHRDWGERTVNEGQGRVTRMRMNLAESPLGVLARRRDSDGRPFLSPDLVAAGERLREDFELAQMGPRVAQNWERFMTGGARGQYRPELGHGGPGGSDRARERVAAALCDLGPGLGDMVLRCCCFLEGLETAEKRMGWSARSGKIVLRIALMRLKRHYDETYGGAAPLIG